MNHPCLYYWLISSIICFFWDIFDIRGRFLWFDMVILGISSLLLGWLVIPIRLINKIPEFKKKD